MSGAYIGITGFTKRDEVLSVLSVLPDNGNRKIMVGVIATWKSLRGVPMKPRWQKQTPDPKSLNELFVDDPRMLNLVHYSTEEGQESSLFDDMLDIHRRAGPNFHGFQLNLVWPDYEVIHDCAMRGDHIVLQLGQKAVELAGFA